MSRPDDAVTSQPDDAADDVASQPRAAADDDVTSQPRAAAEPADAPAQSRISPAESMIALAPLGDGDAGACVDGVCSLP